LRYIRKYGWIIVNTINDIIVFENTQKGIRLYGKMPRNRPYVFEIAEIFVDEAYKAEVKNKVVIDVGAYLGESAIYFAINGAKR